MALRGLVPVLHDGAEIITAGVLSAEVESSKINFADYDTLVLELDYTYSAATHVHVKVYSVDGTDEFQSTHNDKADPADIVNYVETINIITAAANFKRLLEPMKLQANSIIVKVSSTSGDGSDLVTVKAYKRYAL